jgi:trehalose-6-phosphate synthase
MTILQKTTITASPTGEECDMILIYVDLIYGSSFNSFFFFYSILWPLFHYHPGEISFNEQWWDAYQKVNELFAEAIVKIVEDGDLVWVQDQEGYQDRLVPSHSFPQQ